MKYLKKNKDTLALLRHILESAETRVMDKNIDPEYKAILEERIPKLKDKIKSFEETLLN